MKLRELFEEISRPATVGICYGRWNPPHKGHRAAWELAAQFDEWYSCFDIQEDATLYIAPKDRIRIF